MELTSLVSIYTWYKTFQQKGCICKGRSLGPAPVSDATVDCLGLLPTLTYSMVQSPSWEASQEIARISQNPKVHYRTHKRPPPVSILGQPNPVHIHTSHFLEIHPNIIRPSTPRSPQWSPYLRFPHQDPVHPPSPHPYAPHAQAISFFSILSPAQYWVRSISHLAPRYAISSIPPLPRPS